MSWLDNLLRKRREEVGTVSNWSTGTRLYLWEEHPITLRVQDGLGSYDEILSSEIRIGKDDSTEGMFAMTFLSRFHGKLAVVAMMDDAQMDKLIEMFEQYRAMREEQCDD